MNEMTLIVHGWSDCSDSFADMKKFLVQQGIGKVESILYADYESREDNVTFNDVADGLNDQMIEHGLIEPRGKKKCELNVIVHSTGGLVLRHWIHRYYMRDGNRIDQCPVKRLIMLAPANYGSPLAHRGKSFLGSLFKGRWKIGDFLEVGRQLLDGLELAGPFQWHLAHRDLIVDQPYFNADQIMATVLVGVEDYTGIRGWVNKPGTDGTVVIAGTSLDSAKLLLDFSKPKNEAERYLPFAWEEKNPPDDFAFGVLPGLDHGTIVSKIALGSDRPQAGQLLFEALRVKTAAQFRDFQTKLKATTADTYVKSKKPQFQQFLLHAVDDYDVPIADFTIEFFVLKATKQTNEGTAATRRLTQREDYFSREVQAAILGEAHTHSRDPSFRRLLVDVAKVDQIIRAAAAEIGPVVLSMRVYVPDIDKGIRYDVKNLQNVVLFDPQAPANESPTLFFPNTTTLIELRIDRSNTYVRISR